jgi:hypothetical protein
MQSPLLGFNNNVRHRGRLFHIQTEDSGVRHPHVITHLYMDGGRILKTVKTSYSSHVGSDRLVELVRDLMKEQHKTMFIALRDGQFDYVLEPGGAPPASVVAVPPTPRDGIPAVPVSVVAAAKEVAATAQRPLGSAIVAIPSSEAARTDVGPESGNAASKKDVRDKHPAGRYAVSRPASLFAGGRSPDAVGSIFGDDLISEKSLDEVILSYLSEDLDTSSAKK